MTGGDERAAMTGFGERGASSLSGRRRSVPRVARALAALLGLGAALAASTACDRRHPRDEGPTAPAAPPPPLPPVASSNPPPSAGSAAGATTSSTESPALPPGSTAAVVAPGCTIAPLALRLPAPRRLVAIGDLHGDLSAARAAWRAAGAIDASDHWIGGDLVVVQTGDVLDRGDDERALLDRIADLETQARAAGGAYIMLLGNHELMNGAGDFRYVTPPGFHSFDDVAGAGPTIPPNFPAEARGRLGALGAGHPYARRLAGHAVIAVVGDAIFSHAGVLPSWAQRVDEVNRTARCWMDGHSTDPPPALVSDDSPVWTRAFGGPAVDCAQLTAALTALGVHRMVVGHTVQNRGITSTCDGALWRIDVGLASHYGGPIEVLELTPTAPPKVLRGSR